jgi:mannose-6-phosphate isomerase-like protein (cupin superfamily)
MTEVTTGAKTFEMLDRPERRVNVFAVTDTLTVMQHVWDVGHGEVELHAHLQSDAGWLVTKGEATFYDENDQVIGHIHKDQGVFIPKGTKYWFKNSGSEPLIMFRAASRSGPLRPGQIDRDPPIPGMPQV